MKVSVIMPVFNEAGTVSQAIQKVLVQKFVYELIVVDDGSTDTSLARINKIKHKKLKVVKHDSNQGKGAAISTGLKQVKGDWIIINDADLEYDPSDIKNLIQPIQEGKAEVVYGSRFKGSHTNMFFWHYVGNQILNLLINILFNTTLSDMESCYKLMPAALMKKLSLTEKGFCFEPEVTCQILKLKRNIYEVPISYSGRGYEDGKKMHWSQGVLAIKTIIKQRFT